MKKALLLIGAGAIGLIVLNQSNVINSLILFVLVGAIPGTDYSIPSTVMLFVMLSIAWAVIFRVAAFEKLYGTTVKRIKHESHKHKKRMPRRRYGQI